MNREEWNEKMKSYGYEEYWKTLPSVGNPMVTYQTERYLCICQELATNEDIISLDRDFIRWLKEEKKVEARCGWLEGMRDFDVMVEELKWE